MSESEVKSGAVLELAEEFLDRYRKGERPPLKEYIDRHQQYAAEIKEVFPAMAMMENIAIADSSFAGDKYEAEKKTAKPAEVALKQLGDYRIIREIGHGGMGVVYEAEQVSLGRHVALKVLPQQALANPKTKKRFEREARAAAKLHHTNIVPVFGVGEHDGLPYYAMQFIQGMGLDLVIEEIARLQRAPSSPSKAAAANPPEGNAHRSDGEARERPAQDIARSLMTGVFHRDSADVDRQELESPVRTDLTVDAAPEPNRNPVSSRVRVSEAEPRLDSSSASSFILGSRDSSAGSTSGKKGYWQSVARVGLQVAEALEYAHGQGILHRDIKPSNLLLDTRGVVWVADFGLAKAESAPGEAGDNLTHTGDILGTLRYMPPEAFDGKSDARGDVYSLGLTLYELVAARPAFDERDRNKLIKQVSAGEPARLQRLCPTAPRDLVTVIHKAIEREPGGRYQKAHDLAEDLRRFLEDRPVKARRISKVERLVRWCRRNPMVAASLAGVVGIFLTAFALVSWSYFRAEDALAEEAKQRNAADQATAEAQRERAAERWERYRSNLIAAGSAMQLHNVGAARNALDAAPKEHRDWEWRHFYHQLDTAQFSQSLSRQVYEPRFSADGGMVALQFYAPGSAIHIWDLTGRKELALIQHVASSGTTRFSHDGALLAYARPDHSIDLWDVAAQRSRVILRGHELATYDPRFSSDSTRLAAGCMDQTARVWDAATGKQLLVLRGHNDVVSTVSFSPDGGRLATAAENDRTARLWDPATGKITAVLAGHEEKVTRVQFSPRGDRVLTMEYYPSNNVRLWDPATGKLLAILRGHTNQIQCLEFNVDGSRIASGSFDQTVRLWDGRTGAPIATQLGHAGWVKAVAFSPDGKRLASASQDQTVRLWDAVTGSSLGTLHGHTAEVQGAAYSADGSTLISVSADGDIRWWDVRLAERNGVLRGHTNFIYGVAFHPDGERVASASWDGAVRIWNATTGSQRSLLQYPEKTIVTSVSFHPAGKLVATLGRDDAIRIWDVNTGQEVQRLVVPTKTWQDSRVTFSPRGDRLACGSKDNAVHVWDAKTWAEVAVLRGHKDFVRDVVFAPDSTWLASAGEINDKTIRIWDMAKKEQIQVLEGHTSAVYALALSHDGKWLASGSTDGTVRLWDTATWKDAAVLKHGSNIYGLSFTPHGARLACACANNTIRLWDVATHKEVAELHGHGAYVHQVAFSPDGTRLVSGSGDFTVRVWDSLSAQERATQTADKQLPERQRIP